MFAPDSASPPSPPLPSSCPSPPVHEDPLIVVPSSFSIPSMSVEEFHDWLSSPVVRELLVQIHPPFQHLLYSPTEKSTISTAGFQNSELSTSVLPFNDENTFPSSSSNNNNLLPPPPLSSSPSAIPSSSTSSSRQLSEYDMLEICVQVITASDVVVRVVGVHVGITLFNLHRLITLTLGIPESISARYTHVWVFCAGGLYGGGGDCSFGSLSRQLDIQTDRHITLKQILTVETVQQQQHIAEHQQTKQQHQNTFEHQQTYGHQQQQGICKQQQTKQQLQQPGSSDNPSSCSYVWSDGNLLSLPPLPRYVFGGLRCSLQVVDILTGSQTASKDLIWVPRCCDGCVGELPSVSNWLDTEEISRPAGPPDTQPDIDYINRCIMSTRFSKNVAMSRRTQRKRMEIIDDGILADYRMRLRPFFVGASGPLLPATNIEQITGGGHATDGEAVVSRAVLYNSHNNNTMQVDGPSDGYGVVDGEFVGVGVGGEGGSNGGGFEDNQLQGGDEILCMLGEGEQIITQVDENFKVQNGGNVKQQQQQQRCLRQRNSGSTRASFGDDGEEEEQHEINSGDESSADAEYFPVADDCDDFEEQIRSCRITTTNSKRAGKCFVAVGNVGGKAKDDEVNDNSRKRKRRATNNNKGEGRKSGDAVCCKVVARVGKAKRRSGGCVGGAEQMTCEDTNTVVVVAAEETNSFPPAAADLFYYPTSLPTDNNPNNYDAAVADNTAQQFIHPPGAPPSSTHCLQPLYCSPLAPFFIPPAPEDMICETPGGSDLLSSLLYVQPPHTTYTDPPPPLLSSVVDEDLIAFMSPAPVEVNSTHDGTMLYPDCSTAQQQQQQQPAPAVVDWLAIAGDGECGEAAGAEFFMPSGNFGLEVEHFGDTNRNTTGAVRRRRGGVKRAAGVAASGRGRKKVGQDGDGERKSNRDAENNNNSKNNTNTTNNTTTNNNTTNNTTTNNTTTNTTSNTKEEVCVQEEGEQEMLIICQQQDNINPSVVSAPPTC
eukprot:GHVS01069679.1.p1 GENE.GHVS01069679.1~~GHVS01069679.1.p1  ORF type:complete len:1037 (-),score=350.12 GHVS01069679.1:609-3596(-)